MSVKLITKITVPQELWATSLLPEGILEAWLAPDGSMVEAGDPIAAVRLEDSLHQLSAPARGRLHARLHMNAVVEPGMQIGDVTHIVA